MYELCYMKLLIHFGCFEPWDLSPYPLLPFLIYLVVPQYPRGEGTRGRPHLWMSSRLDRMACRPHHLTPGLDLDTSCLLNQVHVYLGPCSGDAGLRSFVTVPASSPLLWQGPFDKLKFRRAGSCVAVTTAVHCLPLQRHQAGFMRSFRPVCLFTVAPVMAAPPLPPALTASCLSQAPE